MTTRRRATFEALAEQTIVETGNLLGAGKQGRDGADSSSRLSGATGKPKAIRGLTVEPRQAKVLHPLREVSRRAMGPIRKEPKRVNLIEIETKQLQQELAALVRQHRVNPREPEQQESR